MKVFLTTAYKDTEPLGTAFRLAQSDRFGIHSITDSPEHADLILFIENSQYTHDYFFRKLLAHPLVQKFRTKCLMYNEQDRPFYVIPGIYVSLKRGQVVSKRQRPISYIREVNEYISGEEFPHVRPQVLYTFVGACRTARVRKRLLKLSHPRGLIEDTSSTFWLYSTSAMEAQSRLQQMRDYPLRILEGKFALCPRGVGSTTYRLYEAMKLGRAPVILSDGWVAPEGPRWNDFTVTIPESDISHLQSRLEEIESTWQDRGRLARETWDNWFAPDVRFHRMIEQCQRILDESNGDINFFMPRVTKHYLYMRARILLNLAITGARTILRAKQLFQA
jgi:hypothetical protein